MLKLILLLAQTCVSEISLQPNAEECVVMFEVNQRNAKRAGISLERQTQKFNAYWKNPNGSRPWIQYLNHEATEPTEWPKNAKWSFYRPLWQNYLRTARKFVEAVQSGRYRALCPSADDYGGRCDDSRGACDPLSDKVKCATMAHCLGNNTYQRYWSLKYCRLSKKKRRIRGGKDSD